MGRYSATHHTASGVYKETSMNEDFWSLVEIDIKDFEKKMEDDQECLLQKWDKMAMTEVQR